MYRCRVYSINGKTGKEIDIGSKQYKHILRERQRQRERELQGYTLKCWKKWF